MTTPANSHKAFVELVNEAMEELDNLKQVMTVNELINAYNHLSDARLVVELAYSVWSVEQQELAKARKRRKKQDDSSDPSLDNDPYPELPF